MPITRRLAIASALALAACGKAKPAAVPPAAAKAFLDNNAKQPGVVRTPSGLEYKILRSGPATGLHPKPADEVKVNYEGKLTTGEVFDSSYQRGAPATMVVAGLVKGWVEALQLMRPGDEWMLWVPPELGYGDEGAGPIPPGSVLVFKLELIDVLADESSVGKA
ncbi:FKBP-type peptidyl-prolyl cis-trans isomerase [Caulobacter sp. KR2-114]|uniref:FKBP-type peptidyl-prolyl cis-trans isomerase n=1 Tax=Caulobacter sp. KR2-114 TaxID=3400912 RepID=UPI003C0F7802